MLAGLNPRHNAGEYIYACVSDISAIEREDILFEFKEEEGITIIMERDKADKLGLCYGFVAAWITLEINSALEGVGLTAAFSKALADHNIGCNVVAAFHHDHIFVETNKALQSLTILKELQSEGQKK